MAHFSQERKAELSPAIKALCKEYGVKTSLGVDNYSTFVCNIWSSSIDFLGDSGADHIRVNDKHIESHYTGIAREFLLKLRELMMIGNYNNSDYYTDYFDVGWYIDINVGKWNKPYQLIQINVESEQSEQLDESIIEKINQEPVVIESVVIEQVEQVEQIGQLSILDSQPEQPKQEDYHEVVIIEETAQVKRERFPVALLDEMKATGQDFEWYPTTDEIINKLYSHIGYRQVDKIIDVGAGNGKVLKRIRELKKESNKNSSVKLFAIEKSSLLIEQLDNDIAIVGTDFWEQSLIDKRVDCIFSNPPYSQFVEWCEKLIKEANANFVYLVIPQRWRDNVRINDAITARKARYEIVGEFDFLSSEDRQARSKVDLVFINLSYSDERNYYRRDNPLAVDPFDLFVKDHFSLEKTKKSSRLSEYEHKQKQKENINTNVENQLVAGKNLIEALYELYQADMQRLLNNYQAVCSLDEDILEELNVSVESVISGLRMKIEGLKDGYWSELFDRYTSITARLTSSMRSKIIDKLRAKTHIDFTASNAYAVTIWTIKNANQYFDEQLIDVYDKMIEKANVLNYKSNQRVFNGNDFGYYEKDKVSHVALTFRIVLEHIGGISTSTWHYESCNKLSARAADFLNDVCVIARNLGFESHNRANSFHWQSGKVQSFMLEDGSSLMDVRAFLNGNMHIKFNQKFMLALNVEAGRLKGWIHNAQHAADELNQPVEEVAKHFRSSFALLTSDASQLLISKD